MESRKKSIPLATIVAVARFKSFRDYGSLHWTLFWIQTVHVIKDRPGYDQTLYPSVCNIRCLQLYSQEYFPSRKPGFRYVP